MAAAGPPGSGLVAGGERGRPVLTKGKGCRAGRPEKWAFPGTHTGARPGQAADKAVCTPGWQRLAGTPSGRAAVASPFTVDLHSELFQPENTILISNGPKAERPGISLQGLKLSLSHSNRPPPYLIFHHSILSPFEI